MVKVRNKTLSKGYRDVTGLFSDNVDKIEGDEDIIRDIETWSKWKMKHYQKVTDVTDLFPDNVQKKP